jgi:hypothetical protein
MILPYLVINLVVFLLTLLNNQTRITLFAGKTALDVVLIVVIAAWIATPLVIFQIVKTIVKKARS